MLLLDISLRFPAITLLVLLTALVLIEAHSHRTARLLSLWLVSLIALMMNDLPEPLQLSLFAREAIWLLHIPNVVLLWWFALSLFDDDFSLNGRHISVLLIVYLLASGLRLFSHLNFEPGIDFMMLCNRFLRLTLLMHLFWISLKGRATDLVESRRHVRMWLGCAALGYCILMLGTESLLYVWSGSNLYTTFGTGTEATWITPLRIALLLPCICAACILFIRGKLDVLLVETQDKTVTQATQRGVNPKDSLAHKRLIHAMQTEQLYRRPGLSIGQLADYIQIPEHQLRALINQGLGYRNFSSFLNTYRLKEAKTLLGDPLMARRQIFTIAQDVGYASLPTFNRAFRSLEHISPTQYRRQALHESPNIQSL